MIRDDAVRHASLDHIVWDVGFAAVDEARDHVPRAIQFSDGIQLILVQEPLHERPIDLLADATILPIHHVLHKTISFDSSPVSFCKRG